jgi:phosphopentomutase
VTYGRCPFCLGGFFGTLLASFQLLSPVPAVPRAVVIVLDGAGIGELPDAPGYGDSGSNTIGNISRRVPLRLPALRALGLDHLVSIGGPASLSPTAARARMAEASAGKDSVTGHWELMGHVLDRPFPVFPDGFSAETISEFSRRTGRGVLGNTTASGIQIIDELGPEHVRSGSLIVYTSADSVFQIAAHEDVIPLVELYRACEIAFHIVCEGLGVGRVIARPFVGLPGSFKRTSNRRDYALAPPADTTLLDRLHASSQPVVGIGKIEDLFGGRGVSRAIHTVNDAMGLDLLEREMEGPDRGLIFANLGDCDTLYGHRNDVEGYAANLERFDARLPALLNRLRQDDLLVITADHGNDPTTPSTDHSREHVPLLLTGHSVRPNVDLGTRKTFADLGQTLAELFGVEPLAHGTSVLSEILA